MVRGTTYLPAASAPIQHGGRNGRIMVSNEEEDSR